MSGKPLTTNPPFGYMKNPENKDEWIVDEPAAKVVKQIFEMCVSGLGPTQIAKQLHSEKVLTPTEYWNSIGRKCSKPPAVPYNWCAATVADILDKQEYCGDTVNFRTTSKSFKLKSVWKDRRRTGRYLRTRTLQSLTGKPLSWYRSCESTVADRIAQARSVCFQDCSTVRIAVKNCITA